MCAHIQRLKYNYTLYAYITQWQRMWPHTLWAIVALQLSESVKSEREKDTREKDTGTKLKC